MMSAEREPSSPKTGVTRARFSPRRLFPLAVIALAAVIVFATGSHRYLSLETLVRNRVALAEFVGTQYWATLVAFVAIYIGVVALSIPGALFLTIGGGILFGWIIGGTAVIIGATTGAIIIFLIVKSLGPQLLAALWAILMRRATGSFARFLSATQRRGEALAEGFRADAFSYLLFLRLVPIFPFWLVNLVPALAGVRLATFAVATALGIIPATFAFAFVGAGLDSVIVAQEAAYRACMAAGKADCRLDFDLKSALTPELLGAFVALGIVALVPVVVKRLRARSRLPRPSG
jgi:uncharacterized membrane protein YdjX (TVP38/TMEM64 family)